MPPGDLRQGRDAPVRWHYLRAEAPSPLTSSVRARSGQLLIKEPVGISHLVLLRVAEQAIAEPALLRLMKAFSLALTATIRQRGGQLAVGRIDLELEAAGSPVEVELEAAVESGAPPRLTARLSPGWLGKLGRELAGVRRAVLALVSAAAERASTREAGRPADRAPQLALDRCAGAKVLLFTNPFHADADPAEAAQLNPGMHYLITALRRCGASTVLCEGKQPLQPVCEHPPDVDAPLEPADFVTQPEALAALLAEHADLDLVCLTVLERSFGQIRALCRFIRERSRAAIAVGGVFPTHAPEHCFAHLPEASFVVRGDGEQVLPVLAAAVAGRGQADGLSESAVEALAGCEGLLVRAPGVRIAARVDRINRVASLDHATLDWAVVEERHVRRGISLSTSRGCIYGCHFCSVPERHLWRAKSARSVCELLDAYLARLAEIYGSTAAVPAEARCIKLWDDDFFLDRERAVTVLHQMVDRGLCTSFAQATVASFFERSGRKPGRLDRQLIDAIPPEVFADHGGLKMGTESFCDRELKRLGKPYRYQQVRELVLALADRGLVQHHYLILCNRDTTLDDLIDGFERITELRWLAGDGFQVLTPSWLIGLWPTAVHQSQMLRDGDLDWPDAGMLRLEGYPELDYRFVLAGRPDREEVFETVRRFPAAMHFGAAGEPGWRFENVWGEQDHDYLAVFGQLRRLLGERLEALAPSGGGDADARAAERYRIGAALARLGPPRWVPEGLVRRLAPRLRTGDAAAQHGRLADYLRGAFERARPGCDVPVAVVVEADGEGVRVEATGQQARVELRVEPRRPGDRAAFRTTNLSFMVRSPLHDERARRRAEGLIEAVRRLAEQADRQPLD